MKTLFRWVMSVLLVLILFVNVKQAQGQSGSELQMSASYTFGEQVTFVAK